MPNDNKTIVLLAGDPLHRMAEFIDLAMRAGGPSIEIVVADAIPNAIDAMDRHMKLVKELREIERHPRYQDHTPRSPKPRFRKGR